MGAASHAETGLSGMHAAAKPGLGLRSPMTKTQRNGAEPASVKDLSVVISLAWYMLGCGGEKKKGTMVYMYPKNRSWLVGTNDCHGVNFVIHRFNGCYEISGPVIIGLWLPSSG